MNVALWETKSEYVVNIHDLLARGIIQNSKYPTVVETEKYSFHCQEGRGTMVQWVEP